jgi:hypothetical protein
LDRKFMPDNKDGADCEDRNQQSREGENLSAH